MNRPLIRLTKFSENWKKLKLKEILIKNNEKNKRLNVEKVESISNKSGFVKQTEQFKDYSIASKDLSNYYVIRSNYFAYNPSRINVDSIAYKGDDEEISVVSPLYISFSTEDIVNDKFLWYWFKANNFKKQRENLSEGGVRDTLSFRNLGSMEIILPILEEQKNIGDWLSTVEKTTICYTRKLAVFKALKQTLLKSMFV